MNVVVLEPDSAFEIPAALARPRILNGPLGDLPQLNRRQVQIEKAFRRLASTGKWGDLFTEFSKLISEAAFVVQEPEVIWRVSGLKRPNLVAQLISPAFASRLGLGVETPLAHAIVDRMLGSERSEAELRLQLTPVEWGVWTYLLARLLTRFNEDTSSGELGSFVLDRVGPDPFDIRGLGNVVTVRWPVTLGNVEGAFRLWFPEMVASRILNAWSPSAAGPNTIAGPYRSLTGVWRAEAEVLDMPRGLGKLRVGGVLPFQSRVLTGSPRNPQGRVSLVLETSRDGRYSFPASPVANSGGARLTLTGPLQRTPVPREALTVSSSPEPVSQASAVSSPSDVPVTLVVELGRINLPLSRLADLKPGDVVELGRHSREPVELTSGGRLVARGELVQIDTELGVRVTTVYL